MLPERVSNPGPLTYESGTLPIALRGPAREKEKRNDRREKKCPNDPNSHLLHVRYNTFTFSLALTVLELRILSCFVDMQLKPARFMCKSMKLTQCLHYIQNLIVYYCVTVANFQYYGVAHIVMS